MKDIPFTLRATRPLTADVFELVLAGDTSEIARPGQFVNLSIPGLYLRRPISVCDWDEGRLVLLVREVGHGTAWLRAAPPGTLIRALSPLGNGFDADAPHSGRAVLAGGGIGLAPLYGLARRLAAAGRAPAVALGFRRADDAFYADAFASLGCDVRVATEDGSLGRRGFVTDALRDLPGPLYVFACGPMPMLRAVAALPGLSGGQFSLEARMGCGFGACMGCTIQTARGPARVCREGPVFQKEELAW